MSPCQWYIMTIDRKEIAKMSNEKSDMPPRSYKGS